MENLTRVDDLLLSRHASPWRKLYDRSQVAIFHEGRTYSYHDMYRGMMKVAARLCGYHLWSGERIIIHLGNRPETIMAIMGCSYMGCTFVPVADTIKAHRLTEIINDCKATAIITDEKHEGVLDQLGDTDLQFAFNIDEIPPFNDFVNRSKPANPAALMYTSGTTGKPKGVICPQHKIMAAVSSINAYMMHTSDDIVATALPLSHGYGLYQVLTLLEAGGGVLLESNFAFPQQTLDRMKRLGVTGFAAVPSMIHMIMQIPGWEEYLDKLSYITTAGAALPPSTFGQLKDTLIDTDIVPMYGQAECVRALYYPASKQRCPHTYLKSCGVTIPDTKTRILDKKTGERSKFGEGELLIKSPHVMDGYWNDPEATARTFKNGWLHTGDYFAIDKETRLHYFVGRKDELIKIKGERVAPQELDDALMNMPGIVEAASFAVADRVWGKRFVVYVAHDGDIIPTKNDVMRFCKRTLEAFLMPKDVVVVDSIPKNGNGKISRSMLKQLYEANK